MRKYKKSDGNVSVRRNPTLGMLWSPGMAIMLLFAVDFGKHPLSRELDLGTDTSHNSWDAPRPEQWAFWRLCTVEKCWWERFFFWGNLPLPQICCYQWGRNVIVLKTFSVLLFIFFFLSVLFWRVGGDEPEMKHFILVSLTWLGNIFLLIGLVSNQFRNTLSLPWGKVLFFFIMAVFSGGPTCPGGKEQLLCRLSPWG